MSTRDEAEIVAAFCAWLRGQGWTVREQVAFCDVEAEKGADRLYAEAKGHTTSPGLDIDTLYGQLLRRMPPEEVGRARFAVVVPRDVGPAALRVPRRVREALNIDVYLVDSDGSVEQAG